MTELFASSNLIWLVPMFLVCALIIVLTIYMLRRELAAMFKNMIMPQEKRYTLAVPILSNKDKPQVRSLKEAVKAQPVKYPDGYVPSQFTIIDSAQFTTNVQSYKPPKGVFETLGTMFRWHTRKLKRRGQKTAEAALVPPPREPAPVVEPQPIIPDPAPPQPVILDAAPPPAPQQPAPVAAAQQKPQQKIFTGERIIFVFILVIFAVFIIFLGAQVSKLSSAVETQNTYIRDLQNNAPAQQKRVIIYDIPNMPAPKSVKK